MIKTTFFIFSSSFRFTFKFQLNPRKVSSQIKSAIKPRSRKKKNLGLINQAPTKNRCRGSIYRTQNLLFLLFVRTCHQDPKSGIHRIGVLTHEESLLVSRPAISENEVFVERAHPERLLAVLFFLSSTPAEILDLRSREVSARSTRRSGTLARPLLDTFSKTPLSNTIKKAILMPEK